MDIFALIIIVLAGVLALVAAVSSVVASASGSPLHPEIGTSSASADANPEQRVRQNHKQKVAVSQPQDAQFGTFEQRQTAAALNYGSYVYDPVTRKQDVNRVLAQRDAL